MNLNSNSFIGTLLATCAMLGFAQQAYALKDDTRQPIDVLSDAQSLDIDTARAIFTRNVAITQGSIKMKAQKVVVNRATKTNPRETLDAYGMPVYFQQTLDDGKVVKGEGLKVHYDLNQQFITLSGKAKLRQAESQIEGNEITYDVKAQQLKANGSHKKRVRTIIIPSQLQENSPVSGESTEINFNTRAPLSGVKGIQNLNEKRKAEQEKTPLITRPQS